MQLGHFFKCACILSLDRECDLVYGRKINNRTLGVKEWYFENG